ncbi:family 7 extracellular solute-binding protein [Alcanivorax xiamenensis]|uniref:Family 7 extracellular solute-binding protein n=1 Tax=Alcanivorax xiamenensis TaxID=1177156 RepID=A0ABQ6YDC0_9GAMM|nr:C4-dicarboxylate TRAP transporter substrate-binding protein [Alcanivorax xiamenensis]KAF0808349.1 family 7 extracellular solute-binding protein [Alcanivorax xiamenensis]
MAITKSVTRAFLVAMFLVGFGQASAADTLRLALGYPPGSKADEVMQKYAETVKQYTDGSLSVKVYPMSLLSAAEISDGVRDGIADIGVMYTVYFPAMYPHTNLVNESAMQLLLLDPETLNGKEALAFEAAMSEFTLFHCPECLEEYEKQNQVYTANATSISYGLLCTTPVTNQDQLKGKRIRVAGSHWSRWAQHFGASSVSLTINETLEGLSQGVIDCSITSPVELINLGLGEVVTDMTLAIPGGLYAGASAAGFNQDVWQGLTEEQRRAVLRAGAATTALSPWASLEQKAEAMALADKEGIKQHDPDPALMEATRDFVKADMDTIVNYYAKNHGVERGKEMLDSFHEILVRWVDLVQDVDSVEELEKLYWDEIFSKVDVGTYGMN